MDLSNQGIQAEEYSKKRAEILSIFSKIVSISNPFSCAAANSPFIDRVRFIVYSREKEGGKINNNT